MFLNSKLCAIQLTPLSCWTWRRLVLVHLQLCFSSLLTNDKKRISWTENCSFVAVVLSFVHSFQTVWHSSAGNWFKGVFASFTFHGRILWSIEDPKIKLFQYHTNEFWCVNVWHLVANNKISSKMNVITAGEISCMTYWVDTKLHNTMVSRICCATPIEAYWFI